MEGSGGGGGVPKVHHTHTHTDTQKTHISRFSLPEMKLSLIFPHDRCSNERNMCEGGGFVCVCVSVCVCLKTRQLIVLPFSLAAIGHPRLSCRKSSFVSGPAWFFVVVPAQKGALCAAHCLHLGERFNRLQPLASGRTGEGGGGEGGAGGNIFGGHVWSEFCTHTHTHTHTHTNTGRMVSHQGALPETVLDFCRAVSPLWLRSVQEKKHTHIHTTSTRIWSSSISRD